MRICRTMPAFGLTADDADGQALGASCRAIINEEISRVVSKISSRHYITIWDALNIYSISAAGLRLLRRAASSPPGVSAILILLMTLWSLLQRFMATLERKVGLWSQETSESHS